LIIVLCFLTTFSRFYTTLNLFLFTIFMSFITENLLTKQEPKKTDQKLTLLTCVLEVVGSNLRRENDYPD
jgi:hypothetical protein